MPTSSEIIAALTGAWGIARRDPSALTYFEFSAESFWRSFAAFFFCVPFYFVFISSEWRMLAEMGAVIPQPMATYAGVEFLAYMISWVIFPVAMIFVCRSLDLSHGFAPLITVHNWSSILVVVLLAPPHVLYSLGLADVNTALFLSLIAFVTALLYRWQLALTVLRTTPQIAVSVVGVEFLISLAVSFLANGLHGIEVPA